MIQQATYAVSRPDLGEAVREFDVSAENFIGEQCLPILPLNIKAGTVSVITRENLKRAVTKHANGAHFNRVNLITEDLAYACTDEGLEGQLTDEDRAKYTNDFNTELETVQSIVLKQRMEREIRIKDALFNTTTFTGAALYTDVSAAPWDAAASDAIGHVFAAKEKVRQATGAMPDSMAIGPVTLNNLLANTAIKARFPGVAVLTYELFIANLSAIFGLQNLFVGRAVYDSAKEGQVFSSSDIWSDDYALIFKRQVGATKVNAGLGRIITWDMIAAQLEQVEQYREEQTKSDIFRVNEYYQPKIFDAYFGHLLKVDA